MKVIFGYQAPAPPSNNQGVTEHSSGGNKHFANAGRPRTELVFSSGAKRDAPRQHTVTKLPGQRSLNRGVGALTRPPSTGQGGGGIQI